MRRFLFRTKVYRTGPVEPDGTLRGDLVLLASRDPNLSQRLQPDGTLAFENRDHSYGGAPDTKAVPGDPLQVIRALAAQVSGKGVKRVTGRVLVDASLFPEGTRELGSGVVVSPISVNDNVIDVTVEPGASPGAPATLTASPPNGYVRFQNQVTTGPAGGRPAIDFSDPAQGPDGVLTVTVDGTFPAGQPGWLYAYPVPVPSRFATVVFAEALRDTGVAARVAGPTPLWTWRHCRTRTTTASCDSCHRTAAWLPATFSHSGVAPGTCTTCHNGSIAKGKPSGHIPTTASCDSCHRTTAWLPATFSHSGVAPGTCSTCHNGTTAKGKPSGHIPTTASCDSCHRTTAWLPASFSHSSVAPGTCSSCHNGSAATGKPTGHFVTSRACDTCHTTTAWAPPKAYTHVSPFYKAHNSGVTCASSHTSNSKVIAWKFSAYKPDCAGCHASTFKPDAHKKVDSPRILYKVGELKNCSGRCHEYTDNTFTNIKRTRTGEHRSTGGDF